MSSGFGAFYGEKDYLIYYEDYGLKSFFSPEQEIDYFKKKKERHYSNLSLIIPALSEIIDKARKRNLPIQEIDINLPHLFFKPGYNLADIKQDSYPFILSLPFRLSSGRYTFQIAIYGPIKESDLKWLTDNIGKYLSKEPEDESDVTGKTKTTIKIIVPELKKPTVTKMYENFGIYVGTRFETRPQVYPLYQKQVQNIMDEVDPCLHAKLSESESLKQLGAKLFPVQPHLKKRLKIVNLPDAFNPYGPAVDKEGNYDFVRPRWGRNSFQVIVLFVLKNYDWGKVYSPVEGWINEVLPKKYIILPESFIILALKDKKAHPTARGKALVSLKEIGGPRVIDSFVDILLDKDERHELRYLAVSSLIEIVDNRVQTRTIDSLIAYVRIKTNDFREGIFKILGKIKSPRAINPLIAIIDDKSEEYFNRNSAREALKEIGKPAIEPLIKLLNSKNQDKDKEGCKEILQVIYLIDLTLKKGDPVKKQIEMFYKNIRKNTVLTQAFKEVKIMAAKPLYYASAAGNLDKVIKLIEEGADVNGQIEGGFTALMFASQEGHLEIVKKLIEHGVNVNIENKHGDKAINFARGSKKKNREIIIDILKKAGSK